MSLDLQLFAQGAGGEKTEKATPRRQRKAREKGQVAKSQELNTGLIMFFFTISAVFTIPYLFRSLYSFMYYYFGSFATFLNHTTFTFIYIDFFTQLGKILVPITGLIVIFSFLANVVQVGFKFTPYAMNFDLNKINPLSGLKRIFSFRSIFEFLKAIFKVGVIGAVIYMNMRDKGIIFVNMQDMDLFKIIATFSSMIFKILIQTSIFLLFLGILDFLYQRYEHARNLKMSKKEVKDEMKEMEGDPYVKAEIRRMEQKVLHRRKMLENVPEATVVITNPTHYAVALKYEEGVTPAPQVIAKGEDELARKIKQTARENDVPIVENKPLARELYAKVELGEIIPEELYVAVAEIIKYVYQLKGV